MQRYASLLFITFLVFSITSGKQLSRVIGKILCISSMGGCWRGNENHLTPNVLISTTDYGRPIMLFWGLGLTIRADKYRGIWGIFDLFISTHFGTVSPLSMFFSQQFFYQKKPLYPNPKYLFATGITFGLQRIINLAIVCP